VDQAGHALKPGDDRFVSVVERDGRRVGALVCDPALGEQPRLVGSVGAAAALALENERLEAELRARLEELRSSRARIVQAADAERRRLERDLHDGAQQRLVALAVTLRLARSKVESDPAAAAELLDEASSELGTATEELRELARGIHPAVLTDRGLEAALGALAGRAPVPVELLAVPDGRLPGPVESAAYFVVAEALTNVAKYAQATHAEVRVEQSNGRVLVEVSDDGVGGADPARGSGLRGLADRLAALDGRLEVTSPGASGTVVRAEMPCG
jgi:signal transduction histidine kinase